jgi:hypothetical protein
VTRPAAATAPASVALRQAGAVELIAQRGQVASVPRSRRRFEIAGSTSLFIDRRESEVLSSSLLED